VRGRDEINLYPVSRKVKVLATAFYISQNIKKRSLDKPDILKGKEAIACW
jgi:hypothetical protein